MSPLYTLVSRQESEKKEGDTEAPFPFDNLTPEVPGPTRSQGSKELKKKRLILKSPEEKKLLWDIPLAYLGARSPGPWTKEGSD